MVIPQQFYTTTQAESDKLCKASSMEQGKRKEGRRTAIEVRVMSLIIFGGLSRAGLAATRELYQLPSHSTMASNAHSQKGEVMVADELFIGQLRSSLFRFLPPTFFSSLAAIYPAT